MAERQFVVFKLEEESFATSIDQVKLITEVTSLSKVPGTPAYIDGLLNLRGEVFPIVNLKKRFGISESKRGMRIIISNNGVGYLVDDASQSMSKEDDQVLPPPALVTSEYISEVAVEGGGLILVVDLHSVIPKSDLQRVLDVANS